jgi:hypothetical protein
MNQQSLPIESSESRATQVFENRRLDALHKLSPLVQSTNRITIHAMYDQQFGVIRLRERYAISKRFVGLGCQIDGAQNTSEDYSLVADHRPTLF